MSLSKSYIMAGLPEWAAWGARMFHRNWAIGPVMLNKLVFVRDRSGNPFVGQGKMVTTLSGHPRLSIATVYEV